MRATVGGGGFLVVDGLDVFDFDSGDTGAVLDMVPVITVFTSGAGGATADGVEVGFSDIAGAVVVCVADTGVGTAAWTEGGAIVASEVEFEVLCTAGCCSVDSTLAGVVGLAGVTT